MCPDCEVKWRLEVQHWHPVGKHDPDWSSRDMVIKAMKEANKRDNYFEKAVHYKAACDLVERRPDYNKMSKKQR